MGQDNIGRTSPRLRGRCAIPSPFFLSARASADLARAGTPSSSKTLLRHDGMLTHSEHFISHERRLSAKPVMIEPTTVADRTADADLTPELRKRVGHAIGRALCAGLEARLKIAGS